MPAARAGAGCDGGPAHVPPLETTRPIKGDRGELTSGYGLRRHPLLNLHRLHTGIDWSAPIGTAVVAAGAGRVVSAEYDASYGNRVIIDHGAGWRTVYGQLVRFSVAAGDCVAANAEIGAVGSTGLSTGPHLHFEVRLGDNPVDPMLVPTKTASQIEN